jgi:hypothetical protein
MIVSFSMAGYFVRGRLHPRSASFQKAQLERRHRCRLLRGMGFLP